MGPARKQRRKESDWCSSKAALREFSLLKASASSDRWATNRGTAAGDASLDNETPAEREHKPLAGGLLAVLQIPRLGVEVPVFEGTDDLTLNHGVGRIAGTALPGEPGNVGLAGHRDSFFRPLKNIRVGDAIQVETPGKTDSYVVERIDIVTPDDVEVLQPRSVPSLTLVTCYPFYYIGSAPQRYIVTASLQQETHHETAQSASRLTSTNHEFHKEEQ